MCDEEIKNSDWRIGWGCEGHTDREHEDVGHERILFHGKPLHRCPRALMREGALGDLRPLHYLCNVFAPKGILPGSGGFHDQPATFCAVMMFLQGEQNKVEGKQMERRIKSMPQG